MRGRGQFPKIGADAEFFKSGTTTDDVQEIQSSCGFREAGGASARRENYFALRRGRIMHNPRTGNARGTCEYGERGLVRCQLAVVEFVVTWDGSNETQGPSTRAPSQAQSRSLGMTKLGLASAMGTSDN